MLIIKNLNLISVHSWTCLETEVKLRPNDRNISAQHIAILLGATCCMRLGVVGSNLKMVKIFIQHLWMLYDVVVV